MQIKIVTDSTSCLTKEFMDEQGISYLESKILIDDKEYKDLTEIEREEFIQLLDFMEPYPTTTLASPQEALDIFNHVIEEGYKEILYIGLSPNISNQFNSAKVAAKKVKNKIKVTLYQTGILGASQGAMTYVAWKMAKEGKSVEEIVAYLDKLKTQVHTAGFSKDFNTLFRTGKIKKNVGLTVIASVLKLRPLFVYTLDQGVVGIGGGVGFKGAVKKLLQNIIENTNTEKEYELIFSDALAPEHQLHQIEKKIKEIRKIRKVHYWAIPPVVAWALGKGAIQVTMLPATEE
ncbi:MAG: DegV family protein [Candidatus Heimdallarchaeaceae archaeon]